MVVEDCRWDEHWVRESFGLIIIAAEVYLHASLVVLLGHCDASLQDSTSSAVPIPIFKAEGAVSLLQ